MANVRKKSKKADKANKNELIVATVKDVARCFEVTVRTVTNWKADGMPVESDGCYDLRRVQLWIENREAKRKGGSNRPKNQDVSDDQLEITWDDEYRKHKAMLAKLQYEEKAGLLIERQKVIEAWTERFMTIKQKFMLLPRTLPLQLEGLSLTEMEEIIENRVREIIDQFAKGEV